MARYDVTVRVHTGWPVSASGHFEMRRVGRSLPGPVRLRKILIYVEGYTEIVLRTRGLPARMAIHQARLTTPMLGLRRDRIRRIDVHRAHVLRSRRTLLASWLPHAATTTPAPGPGGTRATAA
ncbi:MAG TPA: hypothetical protein VFB74_14355 [Kribbellaceae bacterium]|nr:hypothetical protein [Kribbellaceae bacterium]